MSKAITVSKYPSSSPMFLSYEAGEKLKILGLSEDKKVYYVEVSFYQIQLTFHYFLLIQFGFHLF